MTSDTPSIRERLGRLWASALAYAPPVERREFWATQALIVVIAGGHTVLELNDSMHEFEAIEFVPVSLFLIPVVYAGLGFGLRGSLPTALWCAVLTVPNALLWHAGIERVGEFWQAAMILAVGVIVGHRIDREARARAESEGRDRARRLSEQRYRRLFDTTAEPILLLDSDGTVIEANGAAAALLGATSIDLPGTRLDALAGPEIAAMVLGRAATHPAQLPARFGALGLWVEPSYSTFTDTGGDIRIQLILRDVTAQLSRQEGLEAYARHTMATREEERRRIARDLHDGPVQSLVLLWRELDAIGPALAPEQRRAVARTRAMAEQIAADLRRFSRDLRPSLLDDLGLGPALKAEVAQVAERAGFAGRYVETGNARRLDPQAELVLLRVTQEALHNVERHAEASRVLVRLGYMGPRVRLTVSDDGKGIGRERGSVDLVAEGKLGIVGMRERVRLIGGEVRFRSGRPRGTVLSVVLPVPA